MTTADEALSREVERGMTREDLLRRAACTRDRRSRAGRRSARSRRRRSRRTQIKRGGTFRQATSGGSTDFIDGQHIVAKSDIARLVAGFEGLARFDEKGKIQLHLAEELKAEKANQYLIRVRDGIEFHNGKTLNIDDVIYSIQSDEEPEAEAVRQRRLRRDRPQANQEARQAHLPARALAGRRHPHGGVRAVLPGCRPEGLPAERCGQRARCSTSGQGPSRSRASPLGARACTCATRTTGARASRTSTRCGSSTSRPTRRR